MDGHAFETIVALLTADRSAAEPCILDVSVPVFEQDAGPAGHVAELLETDGAGGRATRGDLLAAAVTQSECRVPSWDDRTMRARASGRAPSCAASYMWISPCLSAARQDDQAAQVERIWAEQEQRGASAQLLRWLPFEKRWCVRENE